MDNCSTMYTFLLLLVLYNRMPRWDVQIRCRGYRMQTLSTQKLDFGYSSSYRMHVYTRHIQSTRGRSLRSLHRWVPLYLEWIEPPQNFVSFIPITSWGMEHFYNGGRFFLWKYFTESPCIWKCIRHQARIHCIITPTCGMKQASAR